MPNDSAPGEASGQLSHEEQLLSTAPAREFLRRFVTDNPSASHSAERALVDAGTALMTAVDEWPFRIRLPSDYEDLHVLRDAAKRLATDPTFAPWWQPTAAAPQVRVVPRDPPPASAGGLDLRESSHWEVGPVDSFCSMTLAAWSVSIIRELLRKMYRPERSRLVLLPSAGVNVLGITDQHDWTTLCRDAPARIPTGSKEYWESWSDRLALRAPEVVLPDWRTVAQRWQAVYLAPGGYAVCEAAPLRTSVGTHLMLGWMPATTVWLDPSPWADATPVDVDDLENVTRRSSS